MNDRPIHLPPSTEPSREPSITVPVWITQSNLDGLHALMQWLDGFIDAKGGTIPGHFELVMHFRQIRSAINNFKEKQK
jgi:hypothetical protein